MHKDMLMTHRCLERYICYSMTNRSIRRVYHILIFTSLSLSFYISLHLLDPLMSPKVKTFQDPFKNRPKRFVDVPDNLNISLLQSRPLPVPAELPVRPWNAEILEFNAYLTAEREKTFRYMGGNQRRGNFGQGEVNYVTEHVTQIDSYFSRLAQRPDIKTYALYLNEQLPTTNSSRIERPLGNRTCHALRPRDPYVVTIDREVCEAFRAGRVYNPKHRAYRLLKTCDGRTELEESLQKITDPGNKLFLREYYFQMRYYSRVFLHVIPDGRVTSRTGVVASGSPPGSPSGTTVISTLDCITWPQYSHARHDYITMETWNVENVTHVDEVFVANHKFHFFHWTYEGLSRMAPFLEFLRENKEIKILIPKNDILRKVAFLEALGISASRVIVGYVTARVVYLPHGPRCQIIPPLGLNMLSDYFLSYIHKHLSSAHAPRDVLILIQRSDIRYLAPELHAEIAEFLNTTARRHNMELFIFSDKAIPPLDVTMTYFHRAALVVAPHGAGNLNLLFSRPGTVLIELFSIKKSMSFSYVNMARGLGHVYHLIRANSTIVDYNMVQSVDVDKVKYAVNFYMENHILKNKYQEVADE